MPAVFAFFCLIHNVVFLDYLAGLTFNWSNLMRCLALTLVLAIGCLSLQSLAAQQTKPTLLLRTATDQTTFHIAERVALTLTLTGPDKKYSIDTASYDRSGRLDIDTFEASPATGWSDPLAQYFSRGTFTGGGLRGLEMLSPKPVSFTADLNEHIRFDLPGIYTITATSHRVGSTGKTLFPQGSYLTLKSNPVVIHIVPATTEWQAETLRSTLDRLTVPDKQPAFAPSSEQRTAAVADLRFLDSPAAIEKLSSSLREDFDNHLMWAAALGLAGVPDSQRDIAIHAMSRRLEQPAFPVSNLFLQIMAQLETSPHGLESAPSEASSDHLPSHLPAFRMVWELALGGLSRKQGAALASTAETLLCYAPEGETAELKVQMAAIVANNFASLPIDRQMSELEYNWDELSRQPMLPILQALMHRPQSRASSQIYSAADLNTIILKRWSELDPEGAAREVTAQLASPTAAFSAHSVRSLPGEPQPQFEQGWARDLVESDDDNLQTLLAALLVRFGTGAATTQVETKASSLVGKWACAPQAGALAYVVKFNSDNAASLVRRAMASTHDTRCYETLFSSVSAYAHGPALNEAAINALQSSNARAAADAAEYLRYFGTEAARQPLLESYRKWNERWASRPGETDTATESGYAISTLGQKLGEALMANQGWLADPKLVAEIVSRCVGEQMCRELRQLGSEFSSPRPSVSIHTSAPDEGYWIGPYRSESWELFEAKLIQFPAGSKFTLIPMFPRNNDQLRLERKAQELFAEHGMTLELAVPSR